MQDSMLFTAESSPFINYPYFAAAVSGVCILLFVLLWMFYRIRHLRRKLASQQHELLHLHNHSSELDKLLNQICQLGKISFAVCNIQTQSNRSSCGNTELRMAEQYTANMLPADREEFNANYTKLIAGQLQSFQKTFTLILNGRQRKHLLHASIFTAAEDKQKKIMSISMDITDFEDQRKTLIKADTLLKEIFENTPGYLFLKDTSSNFVYENCSPSFSALMNKTPDEITGKNDFELFERNLASKIRTTDLKIVRNNTISDKRWFFDTPDGKDHAIRVILRTLHYADNTESILGFGMDVTLQERLAGKMRKRNKELRLLLTQIPDAAMLIDTRQYLVCATGTMQDMLKERFESFKELSCCQIFNCDAQARECCALTEALNTRQTVCCAHCSAYGKLTVKPLINEDNTIDYLFATIEKTPVNEEL